MADAAAHPVVAATQQAEPPRVPTALQLGDRFVQLRSNNNASQSGEHVLNHVRGEHHLAAARSKRVCLRGSPFRKPAVYIGTLAMDWPSELNEAGNGQHELVFSALERSAALTAAFFRPEILHDSVSFAERYPDLVGVPVTKVLVIVQEIDKPAVVCLAMAALLVAVAAGLGLGVGTANAGIGIACFSGTVTAISLLMAILHWASK